MRSMLSGHSLLLITRGEQRNNYGVQALQNRIWKVLKDEPYMGEKVPIRYGAVIKFLLQAAVDALK